MGTDPWYSVPMVYNEIQCLLGRSVQKRKLPPAHLSPHHSKKSRVMGDSGGISTREQAVPSSGDLGAEDTCMFDECIRGIGADICDAVSFCAASLGGSEAGADFLGVAFLGAAGSNLGGSVVSANQLIVTGEAITGG